MSPELFEGLLMLQHRGQDSAGMVTTSGRKFFEHKDNGLVNDVFSAKTMSKLEGVLPRTSAVTSHGTVHGALDLHVRPLRAVMFESTWLHFTHPGSTQWLSEVMLGYAHAPDSSARLDFPQVLLCVDASPGRLH